jgi:hypothetical protein
MQRARHPKHPIFWTVGALVVLGLVAAAGAQEAEDRTLLSREQMVAIINEASGERAMHHVLELVPYPRIRPQSEYEGHFRESTVMANFAKEYGYSNVGIESFPSGGQLWQPNRGELWLVEPESRKLYDIHEVAVSIASGSASGDVTAELVDVGLGRPQDFEGKDVAGKIAIGAGGVGQVYSQAIQRGAVGAIGYSSLRADDYPDQIPSSSINTPAGATPGFGWAVSPRVGRELVGMLARGRSVRLRSIVNAGTFPGELEMVHAMIPGDGSTDQAVMVSAHLYEGYLKQGGNDDNSGCAMTLEIGRTYIKLVKEGKLPPPKRTIHFLWVPELSGTRAWLDAHPDVQKNLVADLNFDMEGVRLTTSRSYWVLHRTPDTFPSFLNDIAQSMMEYVAEIARERVRYRANGYAPVNPVVAPNGSRDPFYIKIDQHYGSSDHVAYMDRGIPSVMFITWPDMWYHSSQDTPDKQDATQYKRGAVVGVGAMTVLATGGDGMASRVVAENLARGTSRMGASHVKGLGYMADVASPQGLTAAYKESIVAVKHQAEVEKKVVQSAAVLFDDPAAASKQLEAFVPVIDQRAAALLEEARLMYRMQAAERGVQPVEPAMTPLEREAASLVVELVPGAGRGGRGGRGGGGGRAGGPPAPAVPQHMNAELSILLRQNKTVLEIRDFVSGEFEPLPLETLMAVLKAREAQGSIRLVPRR